MQESQYGKFFIRRDILEQQLKIFNEQTLGEYSNIQYEDASQKKELKIQNLDLKVTTHRIIFTSKSSNWLAFCLNIENIKEIKTKKGWFGSAIKHANLYTFDGGKIRLVAPDPQLVKPLQNIEISQNKKLWLVKEPPKPKVQNDPERLHVAEASSGMYVGTKQIVEKKKQEINQQENKFQSSFGGDIKALMQHSNELKEIIEYIKVNSQVYKEQNNSEVDQLLEGIGCFDAVTRDDAGKDYLNKLSQQIYNEICINLFNMYGGIIPLLDVYYFYNKRRGGLNYISATEVFQACENFKNIGVKAKISTYENNKVIESTEFDIEKDFEQDIGKYIDQDGITAEQLSKKLTQEKVQQNKKAGTISVMIARIRLNRALKAGKIVIDDRIEGARYFKNAILYGF